MGGMGNRTPGPQRCRNHRRLDQLGIRRAGFARIGRVNIDAVGALRGECHSDCYQFLIFHRNSSFRDGRLIESPKRFHSIGRETTHLP